MPCAGRPRPPRPPLPAPLTHPTAACALLLSHPTLATPLDPSPLHTTPQLQTSPPITHPPPPLLPSYPLPPPTSNCIQRRPYPVLANPLARSASFVAVLTGVPAPRLACLGADSAPLGFHPGIGRVGEGSQ